MDTAMRGGSVAKVDEECEVIIANTQELVRECLQLRHQVYCLEKGYFKPSNLGQETDEFDAFSHHILLKYRPTGDAIGTARIVLSSRARGINGFPMGRVCPPGTLRGLPIQTTGEVSRVSVSKHRRIGIGAGQLIRLGLFQGIVRISGELGLTHWAAIMEPMLHRLLNMDSLHFTPLGPTIEYHGRRQPTYANIEDCMDMLYRERPDIWDYITMDGSLLPERTRELEVA
jgi:N-acyl-L-homoserine lactone synthetase